jgi:hypothetical protein
MRRFIAAAFAALALPVAAQVAPAADYTDLWYLPSESGWGVSITQHAGTNQVYAVWYTYDPREPDPAQPGRYKPIWIVMTGGTWTSPTAVQGAAYVTDGDPFTQGVSKRHMTQVGSFSFQFSGTANGLFTYQVAAPAGIGPDDPAYGLPTLSGTRSITRQGF